MADDRERSGYGDGNLAGVIAAGAALLVWGAFTLMTGMAILEAVFH